MSCSADWTVKLWDHSVPYPIMSFDLGNAVRQPAIALPPFSTTAENDPSRGSKLFTLQNVPSTRYTASHPGDNITPPPLMGRISETILPQNSIGERAPHGKMAALGGKKKTLVDDNFPCTRRRSAFAPFGVVEEKIGFVKSVRGGVLSYHVLFIRYVWSAFPKRV